MEQAWGRGGASSPLEGRREGLKKAWDWGGGAREGLGARGGGGGRAREGLGTQGEGLEKA